MGDVFLSYKPICGKNAPNNPGINIDHPKKSNGYTSDNSPQSPSFRSTVRSVSYILVIIAI